MPIFKAHSVVTLGRTPVPKTAQSGDMIIGTQHRIPMKEYVETTKSSIPVATKKGIGLGGAIQDKLENLKIKPAEPFKKKKKNIVFSLD